MEKQGLPSDFFKSTELPVLHPKVHRPWWVRLGCHNRMTGISLLPLLGSLGAGLVMSVAIMAWLGATAEDLSFLKQKNRCPWLHYTNASGSGKFVDYRNKESVNSAPTMPKF